MLDLSAIDPVTFGSPEPRFDSGVNRRGFIKLLSAGSAGLALALYLRSAPTAWADTAANASPAEFSPNLFIRIYPDGRIVLTASNPECGQGTKTSLPMIIADELDVGWEQIEIEQADYNPALGRQSAGGSGATPAHYEPFRVLGATARTLLVQAAAQTWGVPAAECSTRDAGVHHAGSGRSVRYGDLALSAAQLPVPDAKSVRVKSASEFRLIGRRVSGIDNPKIVTGQPLFGIDQVRPGLVHATLVKCPVFNGKVVRANLEVVKALPGIRDAFVVDAPGVASGVAILGQSTWAVFQARKSLTVEWDEGRTKTESSEGFLEAAEAAWKSGDGGTLLRNDGDVAAALAAPGVKEVRARYRYPFLAHANLEPQNCTALVANGTAELWAPTQNPQSGRAMAAKAAGLAPEAVTVHLIRMGGGFGRRLTNDFMAEAAAIAARVPGTPIKLTWTREDDLQHDWYRPAGYHEFRGGVDASGKLVAWSDHFVTFATGYDPKETHGSAVMSGDEFPAKLVPNHQLRQTPLPNGIPKGPWRAPRSNAQAFAYQSFLDELAHAADADPVAFRLSILGEPRALPPSSGRGPAFDTGRMAGVVRLAAQKSGWGGALPRGQGRGVAFHFSHQGYVAIVAQVTVAKSGEFVVDRVTVAADVGRQIVNLSGAENQAEGSVMDGFSAAWLQEVSIEAGRAAPSNFHMQPLLRMAEAPRHVEIHFLRTDNPVTGLGEPVLPPVAPAIANAIFAAIGKRIHALPMKSADLSWS